MQDEGVAIYIGPSRGRARELERAGLIERGRRQMTILDRPALTKTSCECYQSVRERIAFHLPKTYT